MWLTREHRTSDGYALALGWEHGWAVWTVYGRLTTWAVGGDAGGAEGGEQSPNFQDRFMNGIKQLVSKYVSQSLKQPQSNVPISVLGARKLRAIRTLRAASQTSGTR